MYSQKKQIFAEDYNCIIDPVLGKGGLYIGNVQSAQNLNTLKRLQIKAVLTSCKGIELNHPKTEVPYFLYVPAEDHESCDISKYFNQAASFINDCLQRTNIMVHCMAGVSRSVTLSISYLIKFKRMTFNQAFSLVKSRRKIICPNEGFIDLLKKLEREQPPVEERQTIKFYSPAKASLTTHNPQFSYSPQKGSPYQLHIDSIISKYQNYKGTKPYDKNPEIQPFSYQENVPSSTLAHSKTSKLKRFTSMNVEGQYLRESSPIKNNDQYTRTSRANSFKSFHNIQNMVSQPDNTNYADIDKRIEQIRQKYSFETNLRSSNNYETQKYSNNYTTEESRYPRARASSGYNDYKRTREPTSQYNQFTKERERERERQMIPYADKRQAFGSNYTRDMFSKPPSQLRRLTSLQEY